MIVLKNLTKIYSNRGGEDIAALRNLSLVFPDSGLVLITGAEGSGKTTLLNILATLDIPTGGSMEIDGTDVTTLRRRDLAGIRRTHMGIVTAEPVLDMNMSAAENVALGMTVRQAVETETVTELLAKFGDSPSDYDITLARALYKKPRILLVDNPSVAHVDMLVEHAEKNLVVVATNEPKPYTPHAAMTYCLEKGKYRGPKPEIAETTDKQLVYENNHLPLKQSSKIAWSFFRKNAMHTVLMAVLLAVVVTLFAAATTLNIAYNNPNRVTIRSAVRSDANYVVLAADDGIITPGMRDRAIQYGRRIADIHHETALVHHINTPAHGPSALATIVPGNFGHTIVAGRFPTSLDSGNQIAISETLAFAAFGENTPTLPATLSAGFTFTVIGIFAGESTVALTSASVLANFRMGIHAQHNLFADDFSVELAASGFDVRGLPNAAVFRSNASVRIGRVYVHPTFFEYLGGVIDGEFFTTLRHAYYVYRGDTRVMRNELTFVPSPNPAFPLNAVDFFPDDYTEIVNSLIIPPVGLMVATSLSARQIMGIESRMETDVTAVYADSDLLDDILDVLPSLNFVPLALGVLALIVFAIMQVRWRRRGNHVLFTQLGVCDTDKFTHGAIKTLGFLLLVAAVACVLIFPGFAIANAIISSSNGFTIVLL
ncbi:MAG: ATP-binding cassette domain-containing protein [Firmicutes bacterium]|nr:ATP-binding cassette domain-containing protein [Bacillota bacterium]